MKNNFKTMNTRDHGPSSYSGSPNFKVVAQFPNSHTNIQLKH